MTTPWTLLEAIQLAIEVESICPQYGFHVALTGGVLYKQGARKDLDLVLYRIRPIEKDIAIGPLLEALDKIKIRVERDCGFVVKCSYQGKPVDLMFPDYQDGLYAPDVDEDLL